MSDLAETTPKKTRDRAEYCSADPDCKYEDPCPFCRVHPVFTPEQEEQIQKFLDENSDLMDALTKDD
jgi:hypothetical protein